MPLPLEPTAPTDFDFILGDWRVHHRWLKERLAGRSDWETFEGLSSTQRTLGGFGNLEDNQLFLPGGSYRAVALRAFAPKAQSRPLDAMLPSSAPGSQGSGGSRKRPGLRQSSRSTAGAALGAEQVEQPAAPGQRLGQAAVARPVGEPGSKSTASGGA